MYFCCLILRHPPPYGGLPPTLAAKINAYFGAGVCRGRLNLACPRIGTIIRSHWQSLFIDDYVKATLGWRFKESEFFRLEFVNHYQF